MPHAGGPARRVASGAYGLRFPGVDAAGLLVEVSRDAPAVAVDRSLGTVDWQQEILTDRHARLILHDRGGIELHREPLRARVILPVRPSDADLVHPYLSSIAVVAGHWLGRESLHGGAFVAGGRSWALLGNRRAGKSSLLASLHQRHVPILSDDVVATDYERAFAGPRSVDLRSDAAERTRLGEPIGRVGARERWRVRLGPVPDAVAVGGWFLLGWGAKIELEPVAPADRLRFLAEQRAVRAPPADPAALLRLAALPGWTLRRPREWQSVESVVTRLVETVRQG